MMRVGRAAAAALVLASGSAGLLLPTGKAQSETRVLSAHIVASNAGVEALRKRLSSVATGFEAMLKTEAASSPPPAGSAKAKAGRDLRAFVAKMRGALAEEVFNPTLAMEKLEAVKAEVPKYMELALGNAAQAEAKPTSASVTKPAPPTRADVEALRSSFANATSAFHATQADVDNLRAKLEKVSLGLQGILGSKITSLVKAHVEPEVKAFDDELHKVLAETKAMSPADALPKLEAVQARVHKVVSDLTSKQEVLVKEAEAQKQSLLLGVLMTLQHAPLEQQLSVLRSDEFAQLAVCKALLEKHADNVPLFQQAADFLDGKVPKATLHAVVSNATAHHARVVRTENDIAAFEGRISAMGKDVDDRTKAHERRSEQLVDAVKRASGSTLPFMQKLVQREEEGFDKFAASQQHDTKALQEAVADLKRDDVEAAMAAVGKLEAPMKDLQDELQALKSVKEADFVVLGQLRKASA